MKHLCNTNTVLIWNSNEAGIFISNGVIVFFVVEAKNFFCIRVSLESDLTLAACSLGIDFALPLWIFDGIPLLSTRTHSCTDPNLLGEPRFYFSTFVGPNFLSDELYHFLGTLSLNPRFDSINRFQFDLILCKLKVPSI